jgi:hypothetical protein
MVPETGQCEMLCPVPISRQLTVRFCLQSVFQASPAPACSHTTGVIVPCPVPGGACPPGRLFLAGPGPPGGLKRVRPCVLSN